MIRINLLKNFSLSGGDAGDMSFVQSDEQKVITSSFLKKLIIILIGPLGLYFYENSNLVELQNRTAKKNQTLADLKQFNDKTKNLAEEIKRYEVDQVRLNAQMSFMRRIAEEKANELKLFTYLQEFTPENVWINKLVMNGVDLTINAESDVATDITKFIDNLGNAHFLIGVSPTDQQIRPNSLGNDITTTNFDVKARMTTGQDSK